MIRSNPAGDRLFSACAVGKVVTWSLSSHKPPRLVNLGSIDMVSFGSFDSVIQSMDYRLVEADPSSARSSKSRSGGIGGGGGGGDARSTVSRNINSNSKGAEDDGSDLILLIGTAGCEVFEISTRTGLDINARPLVVTHRGDDAVALCSRKRVACTGGDDGVLRLFDLDRHRVDKSVSLNGDIISCVALAPKLPLVVAGIGARTNPRPGGR